MRERLLLAFVLPLVATACTVSTARVGGPGMSPGPGVQVRLPAHGGSGMAGDTVADRLYFGRDIPGGGGTVSDSAWSAFLREVVTPRFPTGLTVYRAEGQWREDDGRIVSEPSFVLEVIHPSDPAIEAALREIAEDYKHRFRQEAVMRITSPARPRFYE